MPIKDIIGIILLVVGILALWGYSIYEYKTSFFSITVFDAFCIPMFLTIIVALLIFLQFYIPTINPPKKIEENGHTYQLEEFEPEQTIERYGKTYVLVEE